MPTGEAPDSLTIDDECTLVRDDDENPTVKYSYPSLDEEGHRRPSGSEPGGHSTCCYWVTIASFVITDKPHIKRFVLHDDGGAGIGEQETMADRFDAKWRHAAK